MRNTYDRKGDFAKYGSTLQGTYASIRENHSVDLGRHSDELLHDVRIKEATVDALLNPLTEEINQLDRAISNGGGDNDALTMRREYLQKDIDGIRESIDFQLENIRENGFNPSDVAPVIQQTLPLLVLSPLTTMGKYLMPSRQTKTNHVLRKRTMAVYNVNGTDYYAPDCFTNPVFMDAIQGGQNNVLISIPVTNGVGKITLGAATQQVTVDQGAGTITSSALPDNISFVTEELFPRASVKYIQHGSGPAVIDVPTIDESNRTTRASLVNLGEFRVSVDGSDIAVAGGVNFGGKTIDIVAQGDVTAVVMEVTLTNSSAIRHVSARTERKQITRDIKETFTAQFSYGKDQEFDFNVLEGIDLTMDSIEKITVLHNQVKDRYTCDYVNDLPTLASSTTNGIVSSNGFKKSLATETIDINAEMQNVAAISRQNFRESIIPETIVKAHTEMENLFTQAKGMRSVWLHGSKFSNMINGGSAVFTKGMEYAGISSGNQVYTMIKSGKVMNFVESLRGNDLTDAALPEGSVTNSKSNISLVGNVVNVAKEEEVNEFVQGWQFLDKPNASGGSFYRSAENPYKSAVTFFSKYGIVDYHHVAMRVGIYNCY